MSGFACPECDEPSPEGARVGAAYACPGCGNPVLPAARTAAPADERRRSKPVSRLAGIAPWKVAIGAFVILGAAYFGAFALLTAEARSERDRLFALHGPAISTFEPTGPMPAVATPTELQAFRDKLRRFEDRTTYESRVSRIDTMYTALLLAFGAQTLLTTFVLAKTAGRVRKAASPRASRA